MSIPMWKEEDERASDENTTRPLETSNPAEGTSGPRQSNNPSDTGYPETSSQQERCAICLRVGHTAGMCLHFIEDGAEARARAAELMARARAEERQRRVHLYLIAIAHRAYERQTRRRVGGNYSAQAPAGQSENGSQNERNSSSRS